MASKRELANDGRAHEAGYIGRSRDVEARPQLLRDTGATHHRPPLEHEGPAAGPGQVGSRREPIVAGSDHDRVETTTLHRRSVDSPSMDGDTLGFLRDLGAVDMAVAVVLAIAVLRGLWKGMILMAFSLAALAAACIAIRFGTAPFAIWLAGTTGWELSPLPGQILAGAVLGIGTLVVVRLVGRGLRRGVRAVGLGFADRLGGGALGAAQGALLVALAMLVASVTLGTDHPALRDSRTLAALEATAETLRPSAPDVAAPPRAARD